MPTDPLYAATASILLSLLETIWDSEKSMAEAWAKTSFGSAIELDRTKHGDALVRHLFHLAWRSAYARTHPGASERQAPRPVPMDHLRVAIELLTQSDDYNLLTQVLPNLVPHQIILDRDGVANELKRYAAQFPGLLDGAKGKKAKLDPAWDVQKQVAFAQATGLTKTASTFDKFTPPSWRITPFGRTPALNDSGNLSNLPALADPYVAVLPFVNPLGEPMRTAYVTWDGGAQSVALRPGVMPNEFVAGDLEQHGKFISESGGPMLGQALLARGLAYDAWAFWSNYCRELLQQDKLIPSFYALGKLASLRLVGSASFMELLHGDLTEENYAGMVPGFAWSWDKRAELTGDVISVPVVPPDGGLKWADDL